MTSNFLHKESKFTVCPGNSFLAILIVSIIGFLMLLKPQFCNSLLMKFISNSALWIIKVSSLIKSKNFSAILLNVGLLIKDSLDIQWIFALISLSLFLS